MKLLSPTKMAQLDLQNCIVVPPMCTFVADRDTNEVNDLHVVHYGSFALGGCGLIIVEATAVKYNGRAQPEDLGIWDDKFISGLQRITDFIHSNTRSKVAIQLGHTGRKGTGTDVFSPENRILEEGEAYGSRVVSSSAVPYEDGKHPLPHALSKDEMLSFKGDFVSAARRAVTAKFDAVELHFAHGYLLNQFTSPLINQRLDEYGGSFENRVRFPLEIMEGVKAVMPPGMPLIVRISADDWTEGGWTVADSIRYCEMMRDIGVHVVHVSAGGVSAKQVVPPFGAQGLSSQISMAQDIRRAVQGLQVIAVGGIVDMETASDIVTTGKADFVAIGRALLRNPYWVRNEAARLGVTIWHPKFQAPAYYSARKQAAAPGVKSN